MLPPGVPTAIPIPIGDGGTRGPGDARPLRLGWNPPPPEVDVGRPKGEFRGEDEVTECIEWRDDGELSVFDLKGWTTFVTRRMGSGVVEVVPATEYVDADGDVDISAPVLSFRMRVKPRPEAGRAYGEPIPSSREGMAEGVVVGLDE